MKITVKGLPVDDLDPKKLLTGIQQGVRKSILTLEGTAKQETPINTGFLRNAFRSRFTDLTGTLTNTSQYAPFVHNGRAPGRMPPVSAIDFWVKRKGIPIPSFVIARSIAKKGTKANPFMDRTVEKEERNIEAIFQSEFKKLYQS